MLYAKWLDLQLFAGEGTGDGGGEGAASGVTADADAGHQRLLELGVPKEKLRKRAYNIPQATASERPASADAKEEEKQDAAATDTPTEEKSEEPKENTARRLSWDEIMQDPEYKDEMQKMMRARLKSSKNAEATLAKLTPSLELLSRKYGLDEKKLDVDALCQKINDDGQYYEEKALAMGTSIDLARQIDQEERQNAREQREQERTLEQQKIVNHIQKLEQQGNALKTVFPSFDLRKELQNPVFSRLTSPSVGLSVEDAYHAVHRKEIQETAMKVAAEKTAEKLSNAIRSGSMRPNENGNSSKAPSVVSFDYRNATKAQREELKKQIRQAAAQGRKLYPGQK